MANAKKKNIVLITVNNLDISFFIRNNSITVILSFQINIHSKILRIYGYMSGHTEIQLQQFALASPTPLSLSLSRHHGDA